MAWLQSRSFASWIKTFLVEVMPTQSEIKADFDEFEIGFFPPAISVKNPRLHHTGRKAYVTAEKIKLTFYPLQILAGAIGIRDVQVINGDVDISLSLEELSAANVKPDKSAQKLKWEDLFQIRVDQVSFEETSVKFTLKSDNPIALQFQAHTLRLTQDTRRSDSQYIADLDLRSFKADIPKDLQLPRNLDRFTARAVISNSGIAIQHIELTNPGVFALLKGNIKGNILDPRKLILDSDLELRGNLETILAGIPNIGMGSKIQGEVAFNGSFKGDLLTLANSFDARGVLKAQRLMLDQWYFEDVSAEGRWKSALKQEDMVVAIKQATLKAPLVERLGGKPASGGEIEIDAFEIPLNTIAPVQITARLKQAHIHWLVAGALADVFALDFRASGKVKAEFTPPQKKQSWRLLADLDLSMPKFQLDNQRLGSNRPLRRIVATKDLSLKAKVSVDDAAVTFNKVSIALAAEGSQPRTEFGVQGKVDFTTGYAFQADGKVDLNDLETLAENRPAGSGPLRVQVKGPASRVWIHFFPDLTETVMLSLNLGDVKGEIAYDDGLHDLHFKNMTLKKGITQMSAQGKLAFDHPEQSQLGFQIQKGDIHDLLGVFDRLTKDRWWFPTSFFGAIQGQIQVSGGLSMSTLKVATQLTGVDWDYYGEKFRNVTFAGGYNAGTYQIQDWTLTKGNGRITGQLKSRENDLFQWNVQTENLSVNDLDHVSRLDVPIRGQLDFLSQGNLVDGWIQSKSQLELRNMSVRGVPIPPSSLRVASARGVMSGDAKINDDQAQLAFEVPSRANRPGFLRATLDRFDASAILLLLNAKLMTDQELVATVTGKLDVSFQSGMPELFSGSAQLQEILVAKRGTQWSLASPFKLHSRNGTFPMSTLSMQSKNGHGQLALQADGGVLKGGISGNVDLSLIEFLTSTVQQGQGPAMLDLVVSGPLKEPKISGRIALRNGRMQLESFDTPLENIRGLLVIKQNTINVEELTANLARGSVGASGKVTLLPQPYPQLDLDLEFENATLKIYPFQTIESNGTVTVRGMHAPYTIKGEVDVQSAFSKESFSSQGKRETKKTARFTPTSAGAERDIPLFQMDLEVNADQNVIIKNDLFDVEMKGNIRLLNTFKNPQLLGQAELIKGTMSFRDRIFQIQAASLNFDNPHVFNPSFNVVARTELPKAKIDLIASGRMNQMKLEFTSDPVMAESEILSLLALGFTSDDLRRLRADDRSAIQQGEAAAAIFQALDFNRDVQEKTGLELQLQQSVSTQTGQSIFRQQSESDTGASPKLVIKRKIGNQVDVSVGSTVGVGSTTEREGKVEVHVSPGVSVIGIWNNFEGNTLQENMTSYGVDLKIQRRFK